MPTLFQSVRDRIQFLKYYYVYTALIFRGRLHFNDSVETKKLCNNVNKIYDLKKCDYRVRLGLNSLIALQWLLTLVMVLLHVDLDRFVSLTLSDNMQLTEWIYLRKFKCQLISATLTRIWNRATHGPCLTLTRLHNISWSFMCMWHTKDSWRCSINFLFTQVQRLFI